MSLNWSLDKIANYKDLCWRPELDDEGNQVIDADGDKRVRLEPITDCLIWGTMCVEIGRITEKNYEEFHRRLVEADEVGIAPSINYFDQTAKNGKGAWLSRIPTLEEVRAHIGLSTNVYSGRGKNPGIGAFNRRLKRRKKEIKAEAEKVIFPDDVTEEDMKPEKMDKMDMARKTA